MASQFWRWIALAGTCLSLSGAGPCLPITLPLCPGSAASAQAAHRAGGSTRDLWAPPLPAHLGRGLPGLLGPVGGWECPFPFSLARDTALGPVGPRPTSSRLRRNRPVGLSGDVRPCQRPCSGNFPALGLVLLCGVGGGPWRGPGRTGRHAGGLRARLLQDGPEALLRVLLEGEELRGRRHGGQGRRGLWSGGQ